MDIRLRSAFIITLFILGSTIVLISPALAQKKPDITANEILNTEKLFDLHFTPAQRDSMIDLLNDQYKSYDSLHTRNYPNSLSPALIFNPVPPGSKISTTHEPLKWQQYKEVDLPKNKEDLAFYPVSKLAWLIKHRKVTSTFLTRMYIHRLKEYGDTLHCVISLLEKRALNQAQKADSEIAAGHYAGPLMGIPYGVKDLASVEGTRTTWGAMPYKDQRFNETATVVKRLDSAGAVLVAKLTSGALAMGDVWYGGMTRNPWNLKEGSSGSSAGPASATSAGLVAFAIGTETLGSIVSPSTRCGDTGLRPTFGRVPRTGFMALSWSMDKVGPICRDVGDCAIVFHAIYGPDGEDLSVQNHPFNFDSNRDVTQLRVGYLKDDFSSKGDKNYKNDMATLDVLRKMGVKLVPIELPKFNAEPLLIILDAESAAAFDELTRSQRDTLMVRQSKYSWPNLFRSARFIPAVEYIQANRARAVLMQKMDSLMKKVDVYISPTFAGQNLVVTNLTGNPCLVLPNGFKENGDPTSITFMGGLYQEGKVLELAKAYQQATQFEEKHPEMFLPK